MLSDAIIDPLPPQSIYQVVNPTPAKIQRTSAIWASALANYFTLAKLNLELISNIGCISAWAAILMTLQL